MVVRLGALPKLVRRKGKGEGKPKSAAGSSTSRHDVAVNVPVVAVADKTPTEVIGSVQSQVDEMNVADDVIWRVVEAPHGSRGGSPTELSSTESSRSTTPSSIRASRPGQASLAARKLIHEELERVAAQVDAVVGESSNVPPRAMWSTLLEPPLLRGATYLEDGKKLPVGGIPLTHLFAVQAFALESGREHVAGASARLLELGALVPPPEAKFVFTIHWMFAPSRSEAPRDSRDGASHGLMIHAYSTATAEEAAGTAGASGALLEELWSGDAGAAISRAKFLCDLRNGPKVVSMMMTWLGLNATRPLLIGRQISMSVNRSMVEVAGRPVQHVELSLDIAASPTCKRVWRHIFATLATVDVSGTLVLEGRTQAELPEHPLVSFGLHNFDPSVLVAQPAAYPASSADVPGVLYGSYTSDREADSPGSWQATRAKVAAMKEAAKDAVAAGSAAVGSPSRMLAACSIAKLKIW